MTLEDWRAGLDTFDYNGHAIAYRDEGDGPPLLLIHGFPTASWDWHKVWPTLGSRFRLITADLLGFGFSAKPKDYPYACTDQARMLEALLESRGIGEAIVLAHDYGDTVAQELLAAFLEREGGLRLRGVCFLNGGLFPEQHRPRPLQEALLSPKGAEVAQRMSREAFGPGFSEIFGPDSKPTQKELDDFWTLLTHNDGLSVMHLLIKYMIERREKRERWVGAMQASTIPLALINGPEDPVSGRHAADRYCEIIPNPDVTLLRGIGHYPQVEAPHAVLDAFWAFVERVDRAYSPPAS